MHLQILLCQMDCGSWRIQEKEERSESESCWEQNYLHLSEILHFSLVAALASFTLRIVFHLTYFKWH